VGFAHGFGRRLQDGLNTLRIMSVITAKTDADIRDCWGVMAQLRPHLKEEEFVSVVRRQFGEGYRIAFIRHKKQVAAVAGFRVLHCLVWGRFCYVDDLVTDEQTRSQGLGGELLDWLCEFARAEGCQRLELDSGVQRFAAHRFYLRHRMFISCHHFSLEL
jgi:GNAT superfamily N-acetyltransferase